MVKPSAASPISKQSAGLKIRLLPSKSRRSLIRQVPKANTKQHKKPEKVVSSKKPGKKTGKSATISKKGGKKLAIKAVVSKNMPSQDNGPNTDTKQSQERKIKKLMKEVTAKPVGLMKRAQKSGKKTSSGSTSNLETSSVSKVLAVPKTTPTKVVVSQVVNKGSEPQILAVTCGKPVSSRVKGGEKSNVGVGIDNSAVACEGQAVVPTRVITLGKSVPIKRGIMAKDIVEHRAKNVFEVIPTPVLTTDRSGSVLKKEGGKLLASKKLPTKQAWSKSETPKTSTRVLSVAEVKKHSNLPPQVVGLFGFSRQTYTCLDCHSGPFLTRDELNRHKHTCPVKCRGLKVACFTCNELFCDRKALNDHQKNVHWNLRTLLSPEEKLRAHQHVLNMKGIQRKGVKIPSDVRGSSKMESPHKTYAFAVGNTIPVKRISQQDKNSTPSSSHLNRKGLLSSCPSNFGAKLKGNAPIKIHVGLATRITPTQETSKKIPGKTGLSASPNVKGSLISALNDTDKGKDTPQKKRPSKAVDCEEMTSRSRGASSSDSSSTGNTVQESPRRSPRIGRADSNRQLRSSDRTKRSLSQLDTRKKAPSKFQKKNLRSHSVEIGQGLAQQARKRLIAKQKVAQDKHAFSPLSNVGPKQKSRRTSFRRVSIKEGEQDVSFEEKLQFNESGSISKEEYMARLNLHDSDPPGIIDGRSLDDDEDDVELPSPSNTSASAIYYGCGVCGMVFKSAESLQEHRQKEHKGSRSNTKNVRKLFHTQNRSQCQLKGPKFCLDCGEQFSDRSVLTAHKKSCPMASSSKVHACYVCQGESFFTREELQQHKLVCQGLNRIQCWKCGMFFMKYTEYMSHKMEAHGKKKTPSDKDNNVETVEVEEQVQKCVVSYPKKGYKSLKKRPASGGEEMVEQKSMKLSPAGTRSTKQVRFKEHISDDSAEPESVQDSTSIPGHIETKKVRVQKAYLAASGKILQPEQKQQKTCAQKSLPDVRLSGATMSMKIKTQDLQHLMQAQGVIAGSGKVSMLHVSEEQLKQMIEPKIVKDTLQKPTVEGSTAGSATVSSIKSVEKSVSVSPVKKPTNVPVSPQGKEMVQVPAETWKKIVMEHQQLQRQQSLQQNKTQQTKKQSPQGNQKQTSSSRQADQQPGFTAGDVSPKKNTPIKTKSPKAVVPSTGPKLAGALVSVSGKNEPSTSDQSAESPTSPENKKEDGLVTITTDGKNPYKVVVETNKDGSSIQIRMLKVGEDGTVQSESKSVLEPNALASSQVNKDVTKEISDVKKPPEQTYVRSKRKAAQKASAVWESVSPKKKKPDSPKSKSVTSPVSKSVVSEPASPKTSQIPDGAQVVMAKQANGEMVPMLLMPLNALGEMANQEESDTGSSAKQAAPSERTQEDASFGRLQAKSLRSSSQKSAEKDTSKASPSFQARKKGVTAGSSGLASQYVTVGEVVYQRNESASNDRETDDVDVLSVKSEPDEEVVWDFQPVGQMGDSAEGEVEWYVASA